MGIYVCTTKRADFSVAPAHLLLQSTIQFKFANFCLEVLRLFEQGAIMSVGQKQSTKMKSFFGTIFAAVAAFHAAFGITGADVSVADFPRLAGESGDAARIMRAVEKAGGGGVVWFPRGEYEIDSMIVVSNRSSKFSAADRAGLSAKLRKAVRSNAAAADNLAGNGN